MAGPNDGARFASRLSSLLADTHVRVRTAMMAPEGDHAHAQRARWMEAYERELAPVIAPLFDEIANDPDTDPVMAALYRRLGDPGHQTDFIMQVVSLIGLGMTGAPAAAAGRLQKVTAVSMRKWADVLPDPMTMAGLAVRGRATVGGATDWARDYGVRGPAFQALMDAADRPPSEGDILTAYRRGVIDHGRAVELLKDTALRDDAIETVLALAHGPLPPGVAVAAAVQGHLALPAMAHMLAQEGVDVQWAQTWYDTAGNPPGTEEMLHLWRRGLASEADVEQAIREGHVKNKYIPKILGLRYVIPPMRSVVAMMAKGVVTPERGAQMLAEVGFTPEVVAGLVREATVTRHEKSRDLASGQVVALYEDRHLERSTAAAKLRVLGYDNAEAELVLGLADSRRVAKFTNAAIARVHTLYVGHHIERSTASTDLDALGVAAGERDQLIALWDLELSANVRRLTEAQYAKAHRMNLLNDDAFVAALLSLGFLEPDARLLLSMQPSAPPA